jgi:hypothetical protein
MRRWFVYGLSALYQYWLSCYYSLLVFIMYVCQSIKPDHDTKCVALALWLSVMSYHVRRCYRSKMKIGLYDSG